MKRPSQQPTKPALHHPLNRDLVLGFLLFVFSFAVYQPAWNGTPIWDDDGHITKPDLRSMDGLSRIWTQLGATQQYYPLVHTIFWLEYHLWGDLTLGYHLINILLHFFSALLIVCILRLLAVPKPWFVASIFALHPVQVESVAWMSELKNMLSGVFFFSTALAYLHFDKKRKGKTYSIAIGLFILGLMSKTVIATLPVSLLAIFWWKRGKISWKGDVIPLMPFFAIGITSGLFTAWVEHKFIIGGEENTFVFSFVERCLIAGRVFWFYLDKLVWPVNLIFVYPRWNVRQAIWWQYLFPFATMILAGALWALRNRWRAPLAVFICFTATIFPVMGFFNVYPFKFSFVADHFQYLACIGPIVILTVGMNKALGSLQGKMQSAPYILILFALGVLTWNQSRMYADAETLYRATLRKNPSCWMAHNNLGILLAERDQKDEALVHFQKALEFNPQYGDAHYNLGSLLAMNGQTDKAIFHYRKALEYNTDHLDAHYNLGLLLAMSGQTDEAIVQYRKALEINPNDSDARNNLRILTEKTETFEHAKQPSPEIIGNQTKK